MDGDTVTITSLAEDAPSGALLATRPFQEGEVTATNTSVSVSLTLGPAGMPMGQLFGLVDSTDNIVVQDYVGSSGTVVLSANGNDLTTCKLAIWQMNPTPYEVTINSITGIDPEPPAPDPYWTVNGTVATSYIAGEGSELTITTVTGESGSTMAYHTETATGTSLSVALTGGPTGATVMVYNTTTSELIGRVTDISSQSTVTGTVTADDAITITLLSDEATSAALPYTISVETSYS